jgi:hypothetical protein
VEGNESVIPHAFSGNPGEHPGFPLPNDSLHKEAMSHLPFKQREQQMSISNAGSMLITELARM